MFGLFLRRNFSNTSQQVLSGLIVVIVVWFSLIGIDVKAQTPPDPANPNIEVFFDPPYKNFAKCIKQLYFKDNNQIRDYDWDTFASIHIGPEHQKYKIDVFSNRCLAQGINIGAVSNVENFQKVAHCLDEIQFINGDGWYQIKEDRIDSCIRVTRQTLGQFRQPYLDCIIKEKYNPSTGYLDKNTDSLNNLCPTEKQKFSIFPRNIVDTNFDSFASLMSCLDHNDPNGRRPKFNGSTWVWEVARNWGENPTAHCGGYTIRDVFGLQMKTPSQLGISPFGGGNQTSLPDLDFTPIIIDISTEQTCWISKEDKNAGPNLTNIWNPGNWLPIMYKCQNTTPDGRPIPLHPINFIPIAIRLFAFITSLLIWLIILNLVIGIILFIVGVATSILAWVKKILIGSVAVVIVLIFMYFILYFILSIFQG